jgi:sugar phosphate isomerase/epimerase
MRYPKLSIGSWAFTFGPFQHAPWSFQQVLTYAKNAGYDGIEINGFRPHPHPDNFSSEEKQRTLAAEIAGYGLGISGYAPDFSQCPPALAGSKEYLVTLGRILDFCNGCGIKTLRVDTVSPPEKLGKKKYAERFKTLVRTWRMAAEQCAQHGVLLVWEFEPGFWLNKPSEVKQLAEEINHANFKLLFDTSHAYMGAVVGARQPGKKELLQGGVAEYARFLEGHIGHLHLIDSDATLHNDETSTHAAFGEGRVDFIEVLNAMQSTVRNLDWWCIDFCFNPDADAKGRAAAPFVRNLIRKVLP